jgi:NAD(P)-dependent dehydrogenase (short-subunit alcohol dehydrogenase family)
MFSLEGQKALIVGIANEQSIAWGCAKALKAQGADLAVTWLNDKAERFVRPLAEELEAVARAHGAAALRARPRRGPSRPGRGLSGPGVPAKRAEFGAWWVAG